MIPIGNGGTSEGRVRDRPAVLLVDLVEERRRRLAAALSRYHYEIVPATSVEEARRFAAGLGPAVLVVHQEAWDAAGTAVLESLAGEAETGPGEAVFLVLGDDARGALELPEGVAFLDVSSLAGQGDKSEEAARRVRLLLVGHEVGVDPDVELTSLVGDLSLTPILEVVRALCRTGTSGRLELPGGDGEVRFRDGEVVAAAAPAATGKRGAPARGLKAFCRLASREEGPFRVELAALRDGAASPEAPQVLRELEVDPKQLIIQALEDRVQDPPSLGARVLPTDRQEGRDRVTDPLARGILAEAETRPTIAQLLDRFAEPDGAVLRRLEALGLLELVELEAPEEVEAAGVVVVTDSTADLSARLAEDHGIRVVPLTVRFGDEELLDGVDLAPREFYDRLESGGPHPESRPPSPKVFQRLYRELGDGRDLVSVHISSVLSLTAEHARKGADAAAFAADRDGVPLDELGAREIVDSRQVSLGLGMLAVFAARLAHRGHGAADIAARLEGLARRIEVLFVVDTLEYLARGGRIGTARAWIGGLLGIKPILGVVDGEVTAVDRVRGGRRAHPRMLELFGERIEPGRPVIAAVAHAKAPVWADRLLTLLDGAYQVQEVLMAEMGPVVGTHAGPGAVGAALFPLEDGELELLGPLG